MNARKKFKWQYNAIGFTTYLYIFAGALGGDTLIFRIAVALFVPLALTLSGYFIQTQNSWISSLSATHRDFSVFVLPAIIGTFLDMAIRYIFEEKVHNLPVFIVELRETLIALLYCFRDDLEGTKGINVFWALVIVFICRTFFRIVKQCICRTQNKYCAVITSFVMIFIGVLGVFLGLKFYFLPFGLDVAMSGLFYVGIGQLWRITGKRGQKIYLGILIICLFVFIFGVYRGSLIDMAVRHYPDRGLGILISFCGVMVICILAEYASKLLTISQFLYFGGKHAVLIIWVQRYLHLIRAEYLTDWKVTNGISRVLLAISFSLIALILKELLNYGEGLSSEREMTARYRKVIDTSYFISYAVACSYGCFITTMFLGRYPHMLSIDKWMPVALSVGIFAFAVSLLDVYSKKVITFQAVLLFTSQIIGIMHGEFFFIAIAIFILGANNKNYKIIIRINVIVAVLWNIAAFIASQTGYIDYLVYGITRHAFGSVFMLEFALHIVFICIGFCLLKIIKENTSFKVLIIAMILLLFFIHHYVIARSDEVILLILLIGTCFVELCHWWNFRFARSGKVLFACLIPIYAFLQIFMLSVSMLWTSSLVQETISFINQYTDAHSLMERIQFGWVAAVNYGIKPFGSMIYEQGYGGATNNVENYFFLDSAYHRLPIIYGWIFTVSFIGLLVWIMYRLWKNEQYFVMFLFTLAAISGLTEFRMLDVSYNVLPILAFSTNDLLKKRDGSVT